MATEIFLSVGITQEERLQTSEIKKQNGELHQALSRFLNNSFKTVLIRKAK
jgi:hypothetical protein